MFRSYVKIAAVVAFLAIVCVLTGFMSVEEAAMRAGMALLMAVMIDVFVVAIAAACFGVSFLCQRKPQH